MPLQQPSILLHPWCSNRVTRCDGIYCSNSNHYCCSNLLTWPTTFLSTIETRWLNLKFRELGEKWSSSVQKLNYRSFCTFLAPSRPLSRGCSSDKSGCFGSAFDSYINQSSHKIVNIRDFIFHDHLYIIMWLSSQEKRWSWKRVRRKLPRRES